MKRILTKKQKFLSTLIKIHRHKLTQWYSGPRLSQYASGVRVPDYETALRLAMICGASVDEMPYRRVSL